MKTALESLPDELLLRRLVELLERTRVSEAELVAHIGEVDARRLYAREAAPSMFVYSTERLHLSEAEAYLRIAAARAARAHPVLLDMLADGRLHLTAVARLAPHLTAENRESVLARAVHRTKRQIDDLVAELQPRPDVPPMVRKLPERPRPPATSSTAHTPSAYGVPAGSASADGVSRASTPEPTTPATFDATPLALVELRPDAVAHVPASRPRPSNALPPLAPGRYKVQFTASAALRDKLERLQALMRSSVPDGDLAAIIDEAVTEKLARLEARRFGRKKTAARTSSEAEANRPRGPVAPPAFAPPVLSAGRQPGEGCDARPTTPRAAKPIAVPPRHRHIPAAVRREVYERDEGRCRYVDPEGRRCSARDGLEFHHRHPFGLGGEHSTGNISLQCRGHNRLLAEIDFGREAMARHRRPQRREAAVEPD